MPWTRCRPRLPLPGVPSSSAPAATTHPGPSATSGSRARRAATSSSCPESKEGGHDDRRAPALPYSRRRRRGAPSRRPCSAREGGAGGICSSPPRVTKRSCPSSSMAHMGIVFTRVLDGRQAVDAMNLLLLVVCPDHVPELLLPPTFLYLDCCLPLLQDVSCSSSRSLSYFWNAREESRNGSSCTHALLVNAWTTRPAVGERVDNDTGRGALINYILTFPVVLKELWA